MQRQARATVELMRETYSRIRSDEEKKKGLVILRALYGKLPASKDFVLSTRSAEDFVRAEK